MKPLDDIKTWYKFKKKHSLENRAMWTNRVNNRNKHVSKEVVCYYNEQARSNQNQEDKVRREQKKRFVALKNKIISKRN